jgi:hypothetical protein
MKRASTPDDQWMPVLAVKPDGLKFDTPTIAAELPMNFER